MTSQSSGSISQSPQTIDTGWVETSDRGRYSSRRKVEVQYDAEGLPQKINLISQNAFWHFLESYATDSNSKFGELLRRIGVHEGVGVETRTLKLSLKFRNIRKKNCKAANDPYKAILKRDLEKTLIGSGKKIEDPIEESINTTVTNHFQELSNNLDQREALENQATLFVGKFKKTPFEGSVARKWEGFPQHIFDLGTQFQGLQHEFSEKSRETLEECRAAAKSEMDKILPRAESPPAAPSSGTPYFQVRFSEIRKKSPDIENLIARKEEEWGTLRSRIDGATTVEELSSIMEAIKENQEADEILYQMLSDERSPLSIEDCHTMILTQASGLARSIDPGQTSLPLDLHQLKEIASYNLDPKIHLDPAMRTELTRLQGCVRCLDIIGNVQQAKQAQAKADAEQAKIREAEQAKADAEAAQAKAKADAEAEQAKAREAQLKAKEAQEKAKQAQAKANQEYEALFYNALIGERRKQLKELELQSPKPDAEQTEAIETLSFLLQDEENTKVQQGADKIWQEWYKKPPGSAPRTPNDCLKGVLQDGIKLLLQIDADTPQPITTEQFLGKVYDLQNRKQDLPVAKQQLLEKLIPYGVCIKFLQGTWPKIFSQEMYQRNGIRPLTKSISSRAPKSFNKDPEAWKKIIAFVHQLETTRQLEITNIMDSPPTDLESAKAHFIRTQKAFDTIIKNILSEFEERPFNEEQFAIKGMQLAAEQIASLLPISRLQADFDPKQATPEKILEIALSLKERGLRGESIEKVRAFKSYAAIIQSLMNTMQHRMEERINTLQKRTAYQQRIQEMIPGMAETQLSVWRDHPIFYEKRQKLPRTLRKQEDIRDKILEDVHHDSTDLTALQSGIAHAKKIASALPKIPLNKLSESCQEIFDNSQKPFATVYPRVTENYRKTSAGFIVSIKQAANNFKEAYQEDTFRLPGLTNLQTKQLIEAILKEFRLMPIRIEESTQKTIIDITKLNEQYNQLTRLNKIYAILRETIPVKDKARLLALWTSDSLPLLKKIEETEKILQDFQKQIK